LSSRLGGMSIIWCCRYSLNFTTHPSFDAHFIPSAISFEALFSDNLRIRRSHTGGVHFECGTISLSTAVKRDLQLSSKSESLRKYFVCGLLPIEIFTLYIYFDVVGYKVKYLRLRPSALMRLSENRG